MVLDRCSSVCAIDSLLGNILLFIYIELVRLEFPSDPDTAGSGTYPSRSTRRANENPVI